MTRRAVAVLALVGLLAGCTSTTRTSGPSPATPSAVSSVAPTTTSSTAPSSTAPLSRAATSRPAPRSSTVSSTPRGSGTPGGPCRDGQLRIDLGEGDGAGGHNGFPIRFRNISATACVLQGYPGVDVLAADGQVLAHAARTEHGFMGGSRAGVPRVVLLPGGYASAVVEWASQDAQHPGGGGCDGGAAMAVTAANTYDAVRFTRDDVGSCSLQVHPTVPGRTGNDPTP